MTPLRIGTRGSALALAQAGQAARRLEAAGVACELVIIRTSGDKLAHVSLAKVGGKGLFIKELEEALAAGEIDVAIHSMKDVPAELPDRFALAAVTARADVRDVLVVRSEIDGGPRPESAAIAPAVPASLADVPALAALPPGARVGTGSLRRRAQLAVFRPDVSAVPMRGNIDSRVRKLNRGEFDALLLAAAGIQRLGLALSAIPLEPDVFLPAPGQGALAIEALADDARAREQVAALHDPASAAACDAERAFLRELGASCQVPVAAFAQWIDGPGGRFVLDGLVASLDGKRVLRDRVTGSGDRPGTLGKGLATRLLERGAQDILDEAERAAGKE